MMKVHKSKTTFISFTITKKTWTQNVSIDKRALTPWLDGRGNDDAVATTAWTEEDPIAFTIHPAITPDLGVVVVGCKGYK